MALSHRAAQRPSLRLESLDDRDVPAFLTGAEVVSAADAGQAPLVRLIDPGSQTVQRQFLAFDSTFTGGVRVAVGDVNGDGNPDLVVGAGRGGGPEVKVYDGKTGAILTDFFAFDPTFSGGVNVAAADLTGDGKADVIVGAGRDGGPLVAVFDGGGNRLAGAAVYDPAVRNGVRVAAGDVDGDGKADIITSPGPGGGPNVRVFKVAGSGLQPAGGFFAYDPSFTGGVYVASGDVDGDGKADIITGAGQDGGPQVGVFTGSGHQVTQFMAYSADFRGGVRVGAADLTGDGKADVLTAPGPGGGPQVNVYSLPSTTPIGSVFGLPSDQTAGSFVAGSGKPINIPSSADSTIASAITQAQQAAQQAQQAAQQAQQAQLAQLLAQQYQTVVIPVPSGFYFPYYPFFGLGPFGYGFGYPFFGAGYGSALGFGIGGLGLGGLGLGGLGLGLGGLGLGGGLYSSPLYYGGYGGYGSPTLFDSPIYSSPIYSYDPGFYSYDPGYFDPGGYDLGGDYGYDF